MNENKNERVIHSKSSQVKCTHNFWLYNNHYKLEKGRRTDVVMILNLKVKKKLSLSE